MCSTVRKQNHILLHIELHRIVSFIVGLSWKFPNIFIYNKIWILARLSLNSFKKIFGQWKKLQISESLATRNWCLKWSCLAPTKGQKYKN